MLKVGDLNQNPTGKQPQVGENYQSERAGIRTQNQWLKRTESELRFLRPRACHFTLVQWTQNKESLLDAYFKGRVNNYMSSGFFYQKPGVTSLRSIQNNCNTVFVFRDTFTTIFSLFIGDNANLRQ
jgi:hypothetical protein